MTILVNTRQIGRGRSAIEPTPMELDGVPETVSELIVLCVRACVARQHARAEDPGEAVLSQAEIDGLAAVGRIAFGADMNGARADADRAIANALQSYEDGLFRIFLNGRPLGDCDDAVALCEGDVLTFVRLAMLAGGGW